MVKFVHCIQLFRFVPEKAGTKWPWARTKRLQSGPDLALRRHEGALKRILLAGEAAAGEREGNGFDSQGRVRERGSGSCKLWRDGRLWVWGGGIGGFVPQAIGLTTEARRHRGRVWGSGFRVQGSRFRAQGSRLEIGGFGLKGRGFGVGGENRVGEDHDSFRWGPPLLGCCVDRFAWAQHGATLVGFFAGKARDLACGPDDLRNPLFFRSLPTEHPERKKKMPRVARHPVAP